jgi:hypothetical protein
MKLKPEAKLVIKVGIVIGISIILYGAKELIF